MSKQYLTLYFNGYMLLEEAKINKSNSKKISEIKKLYNLSPKDIIFKGYNYNNVIPYTYLTNLLVSLCGGIPIPTNPIRKENIAKNIERTEIYNIFDEMSKNSYYKIDSAFNNEQFIDQIIDDKGDVYCIIKDSYKNMVGSEFMAGTKLSIDSNRRKIITTLFEGVPKKEKKINGEYNWRMVERVFETLNKPYSEKSNDYKSFISILSDIYGSNVTDIPFITMCEFFHDNVENEKIQNKINLHLPKIEEIWERNEIRLWNKWMYVIFNIGKDSTTSNTNLGTTSVPKSYLREYREINKRKQNITGHIIVEIDNDDIINALHENAGFCKFMEEGVCEIVELSKNKPSYDYEDNWTKISDEKPFQKTLNQ